MAIVSDSPIQFFFSRYAAALFIMVRFVAWPDSLR